MKKFLNTSILWPPDGCTVKSNYVLRSKHPQTNCIIQCLSLTEFDKMSELRLPIELQKLHAFVRL
jgi:hypothetical protein